MTPSGRARPCRRAFDRCSPATRSSRSTTLHSETTPEMMRWWDHVTGSVWSQPLGEAIAGPLKGETLELLPSTLTTYGSWKAEHPGGLALDVPGGRSGFDLRRMAVVVDFGAEAAAYSIPGLREVGPVNDTVAGVPLVVLTDPADPDRWAVFSRRLDDRTRAIPLSLLNHPVMTFRPDG